MSETFNFLLKRESLELLQLIGCFYSKKHLDELQSPECYRYIAYRATFCLLMKSRSLQWRNRASIGRLLKKRIMLPNCCVNKIRETFPDPQEWARNMWPKISCPRLRALSVTTTTTRRNTWKKEKRKRYTWSITHQKRKKEKKRPPWEKILLHAVQNTFDDQRKLKNTPKKKVCTRIGRVQTGNCKYCQKAFYSVLGQKRHIVNRRCKKLRTQAKKCYFN